MPINSGNQLNEEYAKWCNHIGFPDSLCQRYGTPVGDWESYRGIWQLNWVQWRQDLCDRFPRPVLPRPAYEDDNDMTISSINQTKEEFLANRTAS